MNLLSIGLPKKTSLRLRNFLFEILYIDHANLCSNGIFVSTDKGGKDREGRERKWKGT